VVHPPRAAIATIEDDLVPGPLGGIRLRWYRPGPGDELPVTAALSTLDANSDYGS
jgi:hypothetical protein